MADVPPVPYQTPLTTGKGLLTVPWTAWFRQLFARVGGNSGQVLINPMTTVGDIIYGGIDGNPFRVVGNTAATKKFLSQTGTGSQSATPAWNVLSLSDIPPGNVRTVTTNTSLVSTDGLVRSDSTSGSLTHTLPACASTSTGTEITVKDVGSAGFGTSVKGSGSDNVDGSNTYATVLVQYDSRTFVNNGTSWDVI
jgi:hypothetical protein